MNYLQFVEKDNASIQIGWILEVPNDLSRDEVLNAIRKGCRQKGKWVIDDTWKVELYGEYCACPHCKEWTINGRGMDKLNYCSNCGADMRGEE